MLGWYLLRIRKDWLLWNVPCDTCKRIESTLLRLEGDKWQLEIFSQALQKRRHVVFIDSHKRKFKPPILPAYTFLQPAPETLSLPQNTQKMTLAYYIAIFTYSFFFHRQNNAQVDYTIYHLQEPTWTVLCHQIGTAFKICQLINMSTSQHSLSQHIACLVTWLTFSLLLFGKSKQLLLKLGKLSSGHICSMKIFMISLWIFIFTALSPNILNVT
jgi:hypothetical protein